MVSVKGVAYAVGGVIAVILGALALNELAKAMSNLVNKGTDKYIYVRPQWRSFIGGTYRYNGWHIEAYNQVTGAIVSTNYDDIDSLLNQWSGILSEEQINNARLQVLKWEAKEIEIANNESYWDSSGNWIAEDISI